MFNIGPFELLVLAIVGLIVLGPERLPGLARDAARLLRTLRELATGARQQLREELGPEFSDVDLRNLNPRAAVQRAVFGDDVDLTKYNPRRALQDMLLGGDDDLPSTAASNGAAREDASPDGTGPVSMRKPSAADGAGGPASKTRPAPGRSAGFETPRFDDDAT